MFLNIKKINNIYLLSAWHGGDIVEKVEMPSDNHYLMDLSKNLYAIKDTKKSTGEYFCWRERDFSASIQTIIVHHTASGNTLSPLHHFVQVGVSSHYLALKESDIEQLKPLFSKKISCIEIVPEELTAYHADLSEVSYIDNPNITAGSRRGLNDYSIGIATVNTGIEPFEDIQYITIANILQRALPFYTIPIIHCTGHCNITPARKVDPSGYFEWDKLLSILYTIIDEYKYKALIKPFETIYQITKGDVSLMEKKFNEVYRQYHNIIVSINTGHCDSSLFDMVIVDGEIEEFIKDKFKQLDAIGYSKRYTQFNINFESFAIVITDQSTYIKNIGILANMLNAVNRMLCYNTNDYKNDDTSYFIKLTRARIECLHAIFKLV